MAKIEKINAGDVLWEVRGRNREEYPIQVISVNLTDKTFKGYWNYNKHIPQTFTEEQYKNFRYKQP